jgi:hypothetical protein
MMQKSTTFTTIFRVKKCYFHYDFACKKVPLSLRYAKIVIFVLSAQNDCFLLGHENEFLVETVRSRLQTHSNAPTKQSSCARNTNTIFSTTAF